MQLLQSRQMQRRRPDARTASVVGRSRSCEYHKGGLSAAQWSRRTTRTQVQVAFAEVAFAQVAFAQVRLRLSVRPTVQPSVRPSGRPHTLRITSGLGFGDIHLPITTLDLYGLGFGEWFVSVRPSLRPSVRPSVRPSDHHQQKPTTCLFSTNNK